MKLKSEWYPTKFELYRGTWRSTRVRLNCSSRLMADLQVSAYERTLKKFASGHLVDLGCGNAPLAGIYRDLVSEYVWADWLNSAHQKFELDYNIDLNKILPLPDQKFDTILLSDVLEHIAKPDNLFQELKRILRSQGILIVGVPFLYWVHEEPHDYHRYTQYKLADFGKKYKLEIIEITEIGGGIDCWIDFTAKIFGAVWEPLSSLPYQSWRLAKHIPLLNKANIKSAKRFPLGYIAVYRKM